MSEYEIARIFLMLFPFIAIIAVTGWIIEIGKKDRK